MLYNQIPHFKKKHTCDPSRDSFKVEREQTDKFSEHLD